LLKFISLSAKYRWHFSWRNANIRLIHDEKKFYKIYCEEERGATTLSITSFNIMTERCYAESHFCWLLLMLFMLIVVMLSVVLLNVVMLSVVMQCCYAYCRYAEWCFGECCDDQNRYSSVLCQTFYPWYNLWVCSKLFQIVRLQTLQTRKHWIVYGMIIIILHTKNLTSWAPEWKGINRKQSTRWQHLSQLKDSAKFVWLL